MINKELFEQFSSSIQKILPPEMDTLKEDFKKVVRVELMAMMEKMELVSREEFDIQTGVLLKTRQKLQALEKQVKALEKK